MNATIDAHTALPWVRVPVRRSTGERSGGPALARLASGAVYCVVAPIRLSHRESEILRLWCRA
jgi:hypothetical protein